MKGSSPRIVVVGGGFAGICAALRLERTLPEAKVTLISDKTHFEYHPALYRVVTGASLIEACVPLREIFDGKRVEVLLDRIVELDRNEKLVRGGSGSRYHYDYLVVALGSETNFFGVPGLKEYSFGMKSIAEALKLRDHIAETLIACGKNTNKAEQVRAARFIVIGAGATGVEMAGQLAVCAKAFAKKEGFDPSIVSVELVEAAPKILPALPARFTDRLEGHLRMLGVNIFLNRSLEKQDIEGVLLKDMNMSAKTVIWTAGVKANSSYGTWGLPVDKRGKVEVDEHLRLKDDQHVFIAGDGAATALSGFAQIAMYDGDYVGRVIAHAAEGKALPRYRPRRPASAIPAGVAWAGISWGGFRLYGRLAWYVRRFADFYSFYRMLPLGKAFRIFGSSGVVDLKCEICSRFEEVRKEAAHVA